MLASFPGSNSNKFSSLKLNTLDIIFVGKVCNDVLYAVTSMLYKRLAA